MASRKDEGSRLLRKLGGPGASRARSLADSVAEKYGLKGEAADAPRDRAGGAMARGIALARALSGEERTLDVATRSALERHLGGRSLAGVKVYAGKHADMAARALGAEAFAVEKNIFFREGRFNTASSEGLGLLAHEFLHTAQSPGAAREAREAEATSMERQVVESVRGGEAPALALDQAPPLRTSEGAGPDPAKGSPSRGEAGSAADEVLVERMLLERILELVEEEAFLTRDRWATS